MKAQRLGSGGLGSGLEGVGKTDPSSQLPPYLSSLARQKYSPALAASLPVLVPSHEDTSTAGGRRALTPESLDLAVGSDLVVLEDGHLDLLPLVLDLLGGGL